MRIGKRLQAEVHTWVDDPGVARPVSRVGLLPPRPTRWVPQRKAEIVDALRGGFITLEEACAHYDLSEEECVSWQRRLERVGFPGLLVKNTQKSRHKNLDMVGQAGL
jgi:hypothetical protein